MEDNDYTFIDFEATPKKKIRKGVMHVYYKTTNRPNYTISFNKHDLEKVITNGLDKCRIRVDNLTGRANLVFNREKGARVRFRNGNSSTVLISNKEMVEWILNFYGKSLDAETTTYDFPITKDLSIGDQYATFLLMDISNT